MGFSSIGSFVVMFFAMLVMVSSIFMIYSSLIESTGAISDQQDIQEKKLATSITIKNISVDESPTPDRISAIVQNDGKRNLDTQDVDVYLDGVFIPRNDSNRTIGFKSENVVNPMHWDPGESLWINVSKNIENGTHSLVVSTEFASLDKSVFTYE